MKLVSTNFLNIAKAELSKLCPFEVQGQIDHLSGYSNLNEQIEGLNSVLSLLKINSLVLYTLDNIKCLKEITESKHLRISCFATPSADINSLDLHETLLINCIDTVFGPAVSVVLIMHILHDIDETKCLDALKEAYVLDNEFRTKGWPILYFRTSPRNLPKVFFVKPYEIDPFSMQTAMYFQKVFRAFDAATISTNAYVGDKENYWKYLIERLDASAFWSQCFTKLKQAKKDYIDNFEADHYSCFMRHQLISYQGD